MTRKEFVFNVLGIESKEELYEHCPHDLIPSMDAYDYPCINDCECCWAKSVDDRPGL